MKTSQSLKFFCAALFFSLIFLVIAPFVRLNDVAFASETGRLYVESLETTLTADETFTASIIVDGGGQSFSSAQSNVSLTNLTVTGFTLGTTFAWWQTTPSASSLSFLGGMQGSTTNTTIYTLTLKAGSAGTASVNVSGSRIVGMVDGTSADILVSQTGASYTITSDAITDPGDGGGTTPPPSGSPPGPGNTDTGTTTPASTPSTADTKKTVTSTTTALTYNKSTVTFDKTEAIANGTDKICLDIALLNSASKPITTTKPVVTAGADATVSEPTKVDNIWKTCLTSSTAGEKKVDVKAASTTVSSTAVAFVAPKVVPAATTKTVTRTADSLSGSVINPKSRILTKDRITDHDPIVIEGKADPSSELIVSVYSDPIKSNVTADSDGNWSVVINPLAVGDHSVEVAYADDQTLAPKVVAEFSVIKYPNYYLWGGIALAVLLIIVIMVLIIVKRRKKGTGMTMDFVAPSEVNSVEVPSGAVGSLGNSESNIPPPVPLEQTNTVSDQTPETPPALVPQTGQGSIQVPQTPEVPVQAPLPAPAPPPPPAPAPPPPPAPAPPPPPAPAPPPLQSTNQNLGTNVSAGDSAPAPLPQNSADNQAVNIPPQNISQPQGTTSQNPSGRVDSLSNGGSSDQVL